MKTVLKQNKGITLIALVITIIILIILAGVSIGTIFGDNGIATKARMGAQNYQNSSKEEKSLINMLLDNVKEDDNGGNPPATNPVYQIGQEVVIGDEHFFVIEGNDNASKDTITLLSKYELKIDGSEQASSTTPYYEIGCSFSSEYYWSTEWENYYDSSDSGWVNGEWTKPYLNINNVSGNASGDAITKADNYAKSIDNTKGSGRLLTYEEANILKNKYSSIIYGNYDDTSTNDFLFYWLGSAQVENGTSKEIV